MRGHKWHPCSYLQLHSISSGGPFSRWYHSAGALIGKRQSRRDDLQSLAYCLVLFHVGKSFIDWKEDLKDPASADVAEHYRYVFADGHGGGEGGQEEESVERCTNRF